MSFRRTGFKPTSPKCIVFDMDDVLCRYDLGRRLRALARITGQTPRDIRAAIMDSPEYRQRKSGR